MRSEKPWNDRLVLLPIRRRLVFCVAFYLFGIWIAPLFTLPRAVLAFCCIALVGAGFFLFKTRRSALLPMACLLCLLGNLQMGLALVPDLPTTPGTPFSGTVVRRVNDRRVILRDVHTPEGALVHPAAVTLLSDEEDGQAVPEEGARIAGYGRLFAPEAKRNPGGEDGRLRALSDGYDLSGYLLPGWEAKRTPSAWRAQAFCRRTKEVWNACISEAFGAGAPFFCAVLGGDRSTMDDETLNAMRETGIIHILTISGFHITMMGTMISALLRKLRFPKHTRLPVLFVILMGYASIVGFTVGILRAILMLMVREIAVLFKRRYDSITSVALAAMVLCVLRPAWFFGWTFRFSFSIVLGMALLGTTIEHALRKWEGFRMLPEPFLEAFSLALTAQICAMPMQLQAYGYLPLLGLPMNLMISLLMPGAISLGLVCILLSTLEPVVSWASLPAMWIGRLTAMLESGILRAAKGGNWILRMPAPGGWVLILFFILLLLLSAQIRWGRRRRLAACGAALLMVIGYGIRWNPAPRYVQLDVGQGDAALFRKGRHAVLVDVGPASNAALRSYLRYEGLKVDGVILSHLDEDHAGALLGLLNSEIRVESILTAEENAGGSEAESVQKAWELAEERNIPMIRVSTNDVIDVGELHASVLMANREDKDDNAHSVVLHAQWQGVRFLLTGDLPAKKEPQELPQADVLKVAHHGSKHSTSDSFLEQVLPRIALISVGARNNYGHPGERVLDALDRIGAQTYRTDHSGCLTLWIEDGTVRVTPFIRREERQ